MDDIREFVNRAEEVYARFRDELEREHLHKFVAIEPESGEYFLGTTLSEAMGAAHQAHPGRLAHAMRVGHKAAIHFGMHIR
jgi:hypothetical protein